ncbi:MAG: hypothetical protein PHI94_03215 [Eubacteriaceae bacterium]|nr:hypothetical protein [Eubacteriaceae bacterium]MDD4507785.1 hypothetical protein [Eubacteriaceae bacterium]
MIKKKFSAGILCGILVMVVLAFAGCDQVSDSQYVSFINEKFSSMTDQLNTLNTQFKDFSEEKLSDSDWASTTKKALDSIKSDCDAIINYDKIPDDYAELHQQLVTAATQTKNTMQRYEDGIDQKDFTVLAGANKAMGELSGTLSTYAQNLKNKAGE